MLWQQPALLFLVSLAPSLIALMFRCQGRGAPFATVASSSTSALTIIGVASLATASGFLTHQVLGLSEVPPLVNALVVPWTLCVGRLQGQRDVGLAPQAKWMAIASAGCVLLLRRLDAQMSMDKNDWVEGEEGWESWSPEELADRSRAFAERLNRLAGTNAPLCKKIASDRTVIRRKLATAQKADRSSVEYAEALHAARAAYLVLRGRAYDEGYRHGFEPNRGRRGFWRWSWAFGR